MSDNIVYVMKKMTKNPSSPYGWEFINDLSAVTGDEESIIEFLLHRLEREQIYTWVGPLLLAINPGRHIIRDFYDESQRKAFNGDANGFLQKPSPHIYAIASRAQYRLINGLGKVCQVVVISGESGTGKTFNARKALDFLVSSNVNFSGSGISPEICRIVHKIGNVFPLLLAFSTASTENNERSSRHGQLLRLQYDKNGIIRGACIRSFLLERTRVTVGSNNFEIFYHLIVGLSDREIDELRLIREGNYAMLSDLNEMRNERRFYEGFQETNKAFEALGFTGESKMDVFRVIALLMHLGNIKFRHTVGEGCAIDLEDEESRKALSNVCSLISLPEEELNDLLTSTLICPHNLKQKHTSYRRELKTVDDCRNRLFSIVRYLYERLFNWIVARVNESLIATGENYDWLGILDIFGFESFENNGIEQLSINYATERLQLFFMEDYLETGQRELHEEGLEFLPPSFAIQVYRERLSAIETIVFSTFNDACQSPIPPCLCSLRQQFLTKEKEASRFFKIKNDVFVIQHYSRAVAYKVDNLLAKNTDKVPTELTSAFKRCNNKLLLLISEVEEENVYGTGGKVSLKKCTALAKLKQSLDCLVKELNKCDSHYVRCTRPRQVDGLWVKNEFREQLACTGILDALPLARCKFPIKFTYDEFYKRYSINRVGRDFDLLYCLRTIINSLNVDSSIIHLGKRLLFITENLFFALENYRKNHRSKCADRIQSFWLKVRERRRRKAQNIVVDIQKSDNEIFNFNVTKSSQNSSAQNKIFTDKLLSVEENVKNAQSSVIEAIDEQLKNNSPVSVVVTKESQSSNEENDVFMKKMHFVEENRQDTLILEIEEIDEQLKNISQVSVVVTKESQSSSEEDDVFTKKLHFLEGNQENISISRIEEIGEQLKNISQDCIAVTEDSQSSCEDNDVLKKKLQSVEKNRKNTSSALIEEIDERLKDISTASIIVTKPSESSNEKDDLFESESQSVEENRQNTLSTIMEEIDERLKDVSTASIIVTKPSESLNEKDDLFENELQSVEENRQNTSSTINEKIGERLKNISTASIIVTELSKNSNEEDDLLEKELQSVEENRQNTSSTINEKIGERLKDIFQTSIIIMKSSQSSSDEDLLEKKLQSAEENQQNTLSTIIEEIDERLKDISTASIIVTQPSESSNEEDDLYENDLQSVEENRQIISSIIIEKIDERLKDISTAYIIVIKPSHSSSEKNDVLKKNLQSAEENRENTSSTLVEEIEERLKDISQASIIVTNPSESSSEDDDVLKKRSRSVEDYQNNNDPNDSDRHDKQKVNSDMKAVKVSQNIPVRSADTGYCSMIEKCSLGKIGSQLSHEEFQIAGKPLHSTNDLFKIVDNTDYFRPISEIGNWKEFYLKNWLETTSSDSENDALILQTEIPNRFNKKYSQSQKLAEDSTLKFESYNLELFYRNRILTRRRPVEIPIRFHTRSTCLPGSHKLPRSMKPRGLEDCLTEKLVSIKYIGCKNH